jgi:hypothetical protein
MSKIQSIKDLIPLLGRWVEYSQAFSKDSGEDGYYTEEEFVSKHPAYKLQVDYYIRGRIGIVYFPDGRPVGLIHYPWVFVNGEQIGNAREDDWIFSDAKLIAMKMSLVDDATWIEITERAQQPR